MKLDPGVFPEVGLFCLKAALFCAPFLLLGVYLEKGVDGRVRTDLPRRALKSAVFLLSIAPILFLGAFNFVNAVRPELLAAFLERHPDLQNIMVMEGARPALLLVALVGPFAALNLAEIVRGDTSS